MKKTINLSVFVLLVTFHSFAQQEKGIIGYENWLNIWTEFKPNKNSYDEPTQILSGNISKDIILQKRHIYLLLGDVFVTDNATLTIEPGTVILGDFNTKGSLTISNGSQLIAEGTLTDPIIFTSNRSVKKPGDWGGLVVLGNAPTNKFNSKGTLDNGLKPSSFEYLNYGGSNALDNSGILRYLRIEFAGKRTKNEGYMSGLTLAGVGNKTTLEHIMVSYCLGDSFDIIGGNLSLSQMVSNRCSSTDYKFNFGTQCEIKNSLAIRAPYVSNSDGFRSIYVASYDAKDAVDFSRPQTKVVAKNMTLINLSKDISSDIRLGLIKEGIYVKADANFTLDKSVISGFSPAVYLDETLNLNNENLKKIIFKSTYFNNCNGNIFLKYNSNNDDLENWYGSRSFDNVYSTGQDKETFIDLLNDENPDFRLRINKIIAITDPNSKN